MRLLFLGGTRFIGHFAAHDAVARGHEVTLLHRGAHASEVSGAREVLVDRADPSALARAVAEARPEVVVDTLAMSKSDAEVTALALKVTPAALVVLSSQDVYASWTSALAGEAIAGDEGTEDSPLSAVEFPYRGVIPDRADYDKKHVEAVARALAGEVPRVTVLRLCAVTGLRDPRRRFGAIVDALDRGEPLPCQGAASARWTHADVRDVARAIVLAAERAPAGFSVFNVGERATPTMKERVEGLARAMGTTAAWRETEGPLPDAFDVLGKGPMLVMSSARIRGALGFAEVTSEEERAADVAAWARATREGAPS